ncbi:tripartite tricarboxylate transporter substrate binding protein, partial [Mesorhizobium sp. M00.F.Ca.ET.186.01.1.1]
MKKKRSVIITLSAFITLALAACGGAGSGTSTQGSQPTP